MVAPVTGPFSSLRTRNVVNPSYGWTMQWGDTRRTWYRQGKPYNLPLPYNFSDKQILKWERSHDAYYVQTPDLPNGLMSGISAIAYVQAYSKFVDEVKGTAAEAAVNWAERKQAVSTIQKRSMQLLSFVRDVRNLKWSRAWRTLGFRNPPTARPTKREVKDLGGLWLEFWLGWSPLISDIGNAVEILQGEVPTFRASGRKTVRSAWVGSGSGWMYRKFVERASWRIDARVVVDNPNLLLANKLGFVNPAGIAWELVPFSFVVDWFANVGDFLGSYTDFMGVSLRDAYRTEYIDHWQRSQYSGSYYKAFEGRVVAVNRSVGAPPGPQLIIRPFTGLSVTRGLTAVSLLLQQLRK